METKRWHKAYKKQIYHPFLSEIKVRKQRLKRMGLFNLTKDSKILEIGCGTGIMMKLLMEKGYNNVLGVEPSEELFKESPIKDKIKIGTAQKLDFKNNSFDCVFMSGVLHHLNSIETRECLKEIKRVLKPNGLFCYNEPYQTFFRWFGEKIIFSPLGEIFKYSRKMRPVLEEEEKHIRYWLKNTKNFEKNLKNYGFKKELRHIGLYRISMKTRLKLKRS